MVSASVSGSSEEPRTVTRPTLPATTPPVSLRRDAWASASAVTPEIAIVFERKVTEVAPAARARSFTRERPSRLREETVGSPKRSSTSSARSSASASERTLEDRR